MCENTNMKLINTKLINMKLINECFVHQGDKGDRGYPGPPGQVCVPRRFLPPPFFAHNIVQ